MIKCKCMCRPTKGLLNPRFKVFSLMVNDCKFPSWLGGRKYPNGVPEAGQLLKLPNICVWWNWYTHWIQVPMLERD